MSATGRGGQRSPADFYATPAWCVRRLLEAVPLPTGRWLEPSAGEGHVIRACTEPHLGVHWARGVEWTASELRPECSALLEPLAPRLRIGNFLSADREWLGLAEGERFAVAIGNPPYRHALEFIQQCQRFADLTALLLRLDFLESDDRADFLRMWTPDVHVLPDRPSFTGTGSDSAGYAWFVWDHGTRCEGARLHVLASTPLEERKAPTACELVAPTIEQVDLFSEAS